MILLIVQVKKKMEWIQFKILRAYVMDNANERDHFYEMVTFSMSLSTQKMPPFNATVA